MSLVDWLRGLTDRPTGAGEQGASAKRQGSAGTRLPRKGGESYAKEWVKVLEESGPDREPFNTYTWELKPDATGRVTPQGAQPVKTRAQPGAPDPFETHPWEIHETDSRDDPWGLKQDPPPHKPAQKDGVNPYDTGVFDASWTGQFDKR